MEDTRSIITSNVGFHSNCYSLTFETVCQCLSMPYPTVRGFSQTRDNILNEFTSQVDIRKFCANILVSLQYPKTLLAGMLCFCLRPEYKPILLIILFSKSFLLLWCTPENHVKKKICRIVIAAIAFGMGADCPIFGVIIHCNLKEYIQQSGQAGRTSLPFKALLY